MIRRFAFLTKKKSKRDTFEVTTREEFRESENDLFSIVNNIMENTILMTL